MSNRKPVNRKPINRAAITGRTGAKKSTSIHNWVSGARVRTLPLAIAPVVLGAGLALSAHKFRWDLTLLAGAVALLLQIGVNFANDYSDGIRGTDAHRVGPKRLTASGLVRPQAVLRAAGLSFALAALAGLGIVVLTGHYFLLAIGAVAIVAAWFYTGGKRPYGYAGLGELAVFVFFGWVATLGTSFIQIGFLGLPDWLLASASGTFAAAVLMVNNIRDLATDAVSGKHTLAVRLGATRAKWVFTALLWAPLALLQIVTVVAYPLLFIGWFALLLVVPATLIVWTARSPKELILVLKLTSYASLLYSVLVLFGVTAVVAVA